MKRTLLGGLVLTLALMFGHVGTAKAAAVNIKYDSFCDGASLTFDVLGGLVSGVRTGCSGGVGGPMFGTVGVVFGQGSALTMGYDTTEFGGAQGLVTVIRADHTWTHYSNSGGGTTIANSGTWSIGTALRPNRSGASSTAGR